MSDFQIYGFDERLKKLRAKHHFTQQYVADKIGVTKGTINKYENGNMPPSLESLVNLSLLYNISLDYLVGIGKETYFHLNGFSDEEQAVIVNLIQGLIRITI